jgi:hypothetical protein
MTELFFFVKCSRFLSVYITWLPEGNFLYEEMVWVRLGFTGGIQGRSPICMALGATSSFNFFFLFFSLLNRLLLFSSAT